MKKVVITIVAASLMGIFNGCGHTTAEADSAKSTAQIQPDAKKTPGEIQFDADSPQLAQIRTEAVEVTNVPVGNITAPGQVEANENRLSHVVLPLAGRITSVDVRIGDYVRQGQQLLTLESPEADAAYAALLQSQAALTQTKSGATKAQADLDREKDLLDHGARPRRDVDLEDDRGRVDEAKGNLDEESPLPAQSVTKEAAERSAERSTLRKDQITVAEST